MSTSAQHRTSLIGYFCCLHPHCTSNFNQITNCHYTKKPMVLMHRYQVRYQFHFHRDYSGFTLGAIQ